MGLLQTQDFRDLHRIHQIWQKLLKPPILHCNGDDPEACVFAAKIATEFRQKFERPVVIDLICYRRFGHNEGDEPAFTQPIMYRKIGEHPSSLDIYSERLISEGVVTAEEVEEMKNQLAKGIWKKNLKSVTAIFPIKRIG